MEQYKKEFIDFLLKTGALRVGGDYSLKSKRISPWFVNIGDFNDGESTSALGGFYADAILKSGEEFDLVYGIPEKGVGLAIATSMKLAEKGKNIHWFFTRKIAKEHGEASSLNKNELIKKRVVGRAPKENDRLVQLDDVFTAGTAKYDALEELKTFGNFNYPLLAIAVDRMEVGVDGGSAINEYTQKTGIKVVSVIDAHDVYRFLADNVPINTPNGEIGKEAVRRMANYLRVYGTPKTKLGLQGLDQTIINSTKSVIPACDVESIEKLEELVKQTKDVKGIGGYKIGFELGYLYGVPKVVETVRKYTDKPIIFDHQKAGTDIPDTGKNFARTMKKSGVDTVIFFPQAGPETERAWIYHALDNELKVIVGGRMTHPAYAVSEGGFITDEGAMNMYRIAAEAGVTNFVVPGNKPEVIKQIRELVEPIAGSADYYAPGFVEQGGKIADGAKAAGPKFHAIVGRGIYQANDMHAAALEHTSQL